MYSNNPKCGGGPFLSSSYDDYFDEKYNSLAPASGLEVECNLPGQYTFFVATKVPSVSVTVCSVAVMGTRYVRDDPVPELIQI